MWHCLSKKVTYCLIPSCFGLIMWTYTCPFLGGVWTNEYDDPWSGTDKGLGGLLEVLSVILGGYFLQQCGRTWRLSCAQRYHVCLPEWMACGPGYHSHGPPWSWHLPGCTVHHSLSHWLALCKLTDSLVYRDTDIDNRLVDTGGEREGRMNWDSSTDICILPCIKWIASRKLLNSSLVLCSDVDGWDGRAVGERL